MKKTCKVYVFSQVHNVEKTIRRVVESVLNQTYSNIVYVLRDNGSTDHTYDICKEYAQKDTRIVLFNRRKNNLDISKEEKLNQEFLCCVTHGTVTDEEYYYCMLDGDDEYVPDFLEKMVDFIEENNLDVAACGGSNIDAVTKDLYRNRCLINNLILDDFASFQNNFVDYHQFMRTIWGKLYKSSTLRKCEFDNKPMYGADTLYCMETFRNANRVGILSEVLHKYYISPKSVSYKLDENRIVSDQILHDKAIDFLKQKCGYVSGENQTFLYIVYCHAIRDTLKVVINSKKSDSVKLKSIADILDCTITQELLNSGIEDELKSKFIDSAVKWMVALKIDSEERDYAIYQFCSFFFRKRGFDLPKSMCVAMLREIPHIIVPITNGKFESALKILNTTYKQKKNKSDVLSFLEIVISHILKASHVEILEKCGDFIKCFSDSEYNSDVESYADEAIKSSPLLALANVSFGFYQSYGKIVKFVLTNEFDSALKQTIAVSQNSAGITYTEQFYFLGQQLSAVLENEKEFISFKKMSVRFFIESGQTDKALEELSDFDVLLPDDLEFRSFRELLSQ